MPASLQISQPCNDCRIAARRSSQPGRRTDCGSFNMKDGEESLPAYLLQEEGKNEVLHAISQVGSQAF